MISPEKFTNKFIISLIDDIITLLEEINEINISNNINYLSNKINEIINNNKFVNVYKYLHSILLIINNINEIYSKNNRNKNDLFDCLFKRPHICYLVLNSIQNMKLKLQIPYLQLKSL